LTISIFIWLLSCIIVFLWVNIVFHTESVNLIIIVNNILMSSQLFTIAFWLKSRSKMFFNMRILISISIFIFRLLTICTSLTVTASQSLPSDRYMIRTVYLLYWWVLKSNSYIIMRNEVHLIRIFKTFFKVSIYETYSTIDVEADECFFVRKY